MPPGAETYRHRGAMIRTEGLTVQAGEFVLGALDLAVARGEYFVLLGPPGAGKTMLLETLCGLRRPRAGRLTIGGRDVTTLDPAARNIGYVPQEYALFPTMTVRRNILFGLSCRGVSSVAQDERLDAFVSMLNIGKLLQRDVHGLSGGEKQRVALARALVIEPDVLLLDEPVSALDEVTRERLCLELKDIQSRTGTTTVHVSHNFEETLTVADRVGVLRGGRLVQTARPGELLAHPADQETARFVRMDNLLEARAESGPEGTVLTLLGTRLRVTEKRQRSAGGGSRQLTGGSVRVVVGIRPENIELADPTAATRPGAAAVEATIAHMSDRGALVRVVARTATGPDVVSLATKAHAAGLGLAAGMPVRLILTPEALHLFDTASEQDTM